MKLADGKDRKIQYVGETTYWFNGGQITANEFMEQLFGDLGSMVTSAEEVRDIWTDPDRRTAFIQRSRRWATTATGWTTCAA